MAATSLKLPEDLKRRIERLASAANKTPHAFRVDASSSSRAAVTGTSRSTVGSRPKTSSSFLPVDTSLRRDTPASKALRSQHRIGGLLQLGTLLLLRKHLLPFHTAAFA